MGDNFDQMILIEKKKMFACIQPLINVPIFLGWYNDRQY